MKVITGIHAIFNTVSANVIPRVQLRICVLQGAYQRDSIKRVEKTLPLEANKSTPVFSNASLTLSHMNTRSDRM